MSTHVPTTATRHAPIESQTLRRVALAGSLGLFVEFYDYGVYGFLAPTIATVFFPTAGSTAALLMTYGIFALTFFFRPLGGVVLGALADRVGRRNVLVIALTLMTGATALIGLLPGYATIGIAAPILLLCLRILQGFSAGGEVASAMSFVGEHAPTRRRGFLMSWSQVGSFSALLAGTLLSFALNQTLGSSALESWGWRIPFLVAAPLGIIGYYIRARLHDTPSFERLRDSRALAANPLKEAFASRRALRNMVLAVSVPLLNSSGYYILFAYMPTYLSHELTFSPAQGLTVTAISLLIMVISIPLAARISDRAGRRPVLLASAVGIAFLAWPCFWLMTRGSVLAAVSGAFVMALLFSGHAGVIHAFLVELFPTRIRNTAYSIGYNVSTAVFGGAAPLVMTALIGRTGSPAIPAYYVVITAVGTALAVLKASETAHTSLSDA
ncbi:MFS transporter [Streptomyces malaysiensis]|uniref:MFS transporter n=1 Tax=Streptomyces malaysiensis TaxID=92644 RepID=UPI002B2F86BB|nr:MFS transporter [Streptomyces malaysiensis]